MQLLRWLRVIQNCSPPASYGSATFRISNRSKKRENMGRIYDLAIIYNVQPGFPLSLKAVHVTNTIKRETSEQNTFNINEKQLTGDRHRSQVECLTSEFRSKSWKWQD